MSFSQQLTNNISVIRIVFEFYPHIGGSIALTEALSQKIDYHLKNQLIIAPDFGEECTTFDKQFKVPIIRVKFNTKKMALPVLPLFHFIYMVKVYFKIKKLDKKYKFDIIHAHGIGIIGFSTIIGKLLDIPVIGAVDGSLKAYSKKSVAFYETITIMLLKPKYLIVADDGPTTTETFRNLLKDRAIIVSIGIDTDIFKPIERNKQLLEKLGLKESDFIILSTSSFTPVKRIDLAIESFNRLLTISSNNDIYLLIAGQGGLRDWLIELAGKSPLKKNIKFVGTIPANIIPDYISIANTVIGTSLYSNMNVSIQEAMACGKPVVAFDSSGISKIINHMGNGLLAKCGDVEDFARNLKILYDNPSLRDKLGQNARKTIVEERNWETRVKREMEIYEKVLSKRNNK